MYHLIFDFDGVIGDTREATIQALMQHAAKPSRESALEDINQYFTSKPNHTRDHTLTDDELALKYKWTSEFGAAVAAHGFDLFEDFVREIESIDTPHKAVVSSGSQLYVLPALTRTKIHPTHILAFEDHHSKEEKIELICRDWHVEPSEVFYFTDTLADVYELQDMISPSKLIGVTWGFCTKEQLLKELDPEHILDTPTDLRAVLLH